GVNMSGKRVGIIVLVLKDDVVFAASALSGVAAKIGVNMSGKRVGIIVLVPKDDVVFAASALSGVAAKIVIAPLDQTKLIM
nr:hypothetical protein [Tanacetum cinerariifolium]